MSQSPIELAPIVQFEIVGSYKFPQALRRSNYLSEGSRFVLRRNRVASIANIS